MNEKYTIYHYVKNDEGQYVSQTIWSGGHLIPFVFKAIAAKISGKYKYINIEISI